MADGNVEVGFVADPSSTSAFEAIVEKAVTAGVAKGVEGIGSHLSGLGPKLAGDLSKQLSEGLKNGASGFTQTTEAAKRLDGVMAQINSNTLKLAAQLKELGAGTTAIAAGINRVGAAETRSSIEVNQAQTRSANERLALLRNEGKMAAIETQSAGQLQVVAAREAGKQRTAVVRGVVETIIGLEKGAATVLEGIARTGVSAVSKVFSGIGGLFKRADREVFNNSVLETSLKERESLMRSSLTKQTTLVSESVTRQEAALAGLREQTNRGLVGQAKNAGLFGFGAAFAAIAAAKSTFTVGADFTRGLAVLQSSLDLTDAQMKKVRQTSIDLGNDISLPGVSALDAAQAIQVLTKQFGSLGPAAVDAAQKAAKGTLQLARASGATAEDAGALIGSAVNVFGIAADDATSAADKIAGALTRAAGVSFSDFKDSFVQGAAVFHQFVGPTEDANNALLDFNTTLAILAKNGITGSNAGAGLKQFFIQATQNTKKASNASKELADRAGVVGSVFFDASGKLRPFNESVEILRKGVQGLSDQARTNVLGSLFGARSITIANALINSSGDSFAKLREQIAKQGLAAKIAAAQNTGLKGALDALSSVIETVQIIVYEKLNKPLGAAVLAVTNFANTILFGAGPALHTLRIALLGVVSGIGALVAAKAAIEVLSLLGKAAALAFTPMGALVVGMATLGAGFALFADKNKELIPFIKGVADSMSLLFKGGTLEALGDKAGNALSPWGRALRKVQQAFIDVHDTALTVWSAVSTFVTGTAIPVIERYGKIVGGALLTAFHATVNFVRDTVIPGFQRFVAFVRDTMFPIIETGVGHVIDFALRAKDAVVGFAKDVATTVLPYIQPAVDGFLKLGGAIGRAFGGDFSSLGSGFIDAGKGIGSTFAAIGTTVLDALRPIGEKVLGFFKDLFTVKNLGKAVDGIGKVLEFAGEQIGKIISNPKVLAAVGIVAGALVAIAGKWALALVKGLAEGIASNAPRLLGDIGSLIAKVIFDPKGLAITAGVAAFIAAVALPLVSGLKTAGAGGATGLLQGLTSGIKKSGGFLQGLFATSSTGSTGGFLGSFKTQGEEFSKQMQGLQNQARALGLTRIYDNNASGMRDAKIDIANVKKGLTDAQVAGLEFRDKLASAFKAVGGVLSGGGGILSGLAGIPAAFVRAFKRPPITADRIFAVDSSGIATQAAAASSTYMSRLTDGITAALGKVRAGFGTVMEALQTYAKEQSTTVGRLIAGGVVKGLAGLTAGVALGVQAGSSGGIGRVLGLAGIASTALAIGGPIGIATAAVGLLATAFVSGRQKADEYNKKVQEVANTLAPKLEDAAKKGEISLKQLQDGLTFKDLGSTSVFSDVLKSFTDSLSGGTQKTLHEFGVNVVDDLGSVLKAGGGLGDLQQKFLDVAKGSAAFRDQFKGDAEVVASTISKILKPGGPANASDIKLTDSTFSPAEFAAAQKYRDQIDAITGAVNNLSTSYNQNADAVAAAGDKTFLLTERAKDLVPLQKTLTGFFATIFGGVTTTNPLKAMLDQVHQLANSADVKLSISVTQRSNALDEANTKLQGILDKKDEINRKFEQGILPPGVTGFASALNDALTNVTGIGKQLDEISGRVVTGDVSFSLGGAQTAQALQTFTDQAQKAFKAGVDQGLIVDAPTARAALQPLIDEAGLHAGPEAKQKLEDALNNVIATLVPVISEKNAADAAANAQVAVQNALNGLPVEINPMFGIPVMTPEEIAAVNSAIPPVAIPTSLKPPTVPTDFTKNATSLAIIGGVGIGAAMDAGIITGVQNNSGNVSAAANAVAAAAVAKVKLSLGIKSPSKVFQQIGEFIIKGLVDGIAAGGDIVSTTITDLVAKAVDSATGAVSDAQKALRGGASSLLSALFGSGSAVGQSSFGDVQAQVTESFDALGSTLESSFNRAADVLKRSATEKLSNSDLNVLGENPGSLNPNDILGAQNRSALVTSIDDIVQLGKRLIDQGMPAAQVTKTMEDYLDQLRILAAQYGLSGADVEGLIGQMGLSQDALGGFVSEVQHMGDVLGTVQGNAAKFNQTVVDLFKGVTDGTAFKSITGVGKADDARAAITAGFSGIAAAADANDQRAQEILKKMQDPTKNGPLTLADQLALNQGLNGRDINTTDQFGIANRTAFESAISNIKALGDSLLAGGSSADYVTQEIRNQIQALEDYGVSLGFSKDQIQDLVNKAGLGEDSLAGFNQAVADAADVAKKAADAQNAANDAAAPTPPSAPATNPTTPAGASDAPAFLPHDIKVDLHVPYGDPNAIALAVGNKIATSVRFVGA